MNNEASIPAFISYSRVDSQFVDRLQADLSSRGFDPWVDRRKLEGGQDWQDELQRAIDRCQIVCVVLTPTALSSDAVRMEYRYARHKHKPLVPLMLKECELPIDLEALQWVDFQTSYDDGLRNLITALSRLSRSGAPSWHAESLRDLYTLGLDTERQGNLEQAAAFFGQVHDTEPGYLNGIVGSKLEILNQQLYPERSRRLWQDAKRYRRAGEYSREVGALQAIIGLGKKDDQAEERLPIAIQNRQNADLYDVARELVSLGDFDSAREQLALLWRNAPYYEDPAGVAPRLGMTAPPSYEEAKERAELDVSLTIWKQEAKTERDKSLETTRVQLDSRISTLKRALDRTSTIQKASDLVRSRREAVGKPRMGSVGEAEKELLSLEGVVSSAGKDLWRTYAQYQSEMFFTFDMQQWIARSSGSLLMDGDGEAFQTLARATQVLCALIGVGTGAFVYGVRWFHATGVGTSLEMALGGIVGAIIGFLLSFPTILVFALLINIAFVISSAWSSRRYAEQNIVAKANTDAAYTRWFSQYAEDNNALLSKLEAERDQRLSEIEKEYQERMVEVNERYEHELGVIASKYQLLRESPNGFEAG